MKWKIMALVLLLSACSSQPQKTYYQLPSLVTERANTGGMVERQLWIEHVAVADYLSGSGLVYQTNDVQYVVANNNLWASALDQQLQQSLVENLGASLPGWLVSTQPLNSDRQMILNVTVTGFHGRYDGQVIVRGEWTLRSGDRIVKHPFEVLAKQTDDGYDALVKVLASAWKQEADIIAKRAINL